MVGTLVGGVGVHRGVHLALALPKCVHLPHLRHISHMTKILFSLFKHYLDLYITDTALKVSRSLCCFTTSISHGVQNYFPRLWGTGNSDAVFTPQPLRAVGVLFSPMVSRWAGGGKKFVRAVSQKP